MNETYSGVQWTALHEAANSGRTLVVKQLLYCKATINSRTVSGRTPLALATEQGRVATAAVLCRLEASAVRRLEAGAVRRLEASAAPP